MSVDGWAYPHRNGLVPSGPFAPLLSQVTDVLTAQFSRTPFEVIVDIGCGNGRLSSRLADRLTPSVGWVLIDRDRQLLAEAHRVTSARSRSVVPVAADVDHLPLTSQLPSTSVLFVASHVLYYAASWRSVMQGLIDLLYASHRRGAIAVVLRSHRSDSYVLRRTVRRMAGDSDPRLLDGDEFAAWLLACGLSCERHRAAALYRPATGPIGRGLRSALEESSELRATLTLLCHSDPLEIGPRALAAVESLLARDGPGRPPVIALEDDVFVIPADQ